ncbi:MAG: DUF5103 domain-containing protein [Saprospiraceae bacterium]
MLFRKKIYIFIIMLVFTVINSYGQIVTSTEDYVYDPDIKSVKFYAGSNPLSYPVSDLSGSISLSLDFDDISGYFRSYYYKIIHCDMDWNISKNINESDYLRGYNDIEIKDYDNSNLTLFQYVNYQLSLPNSDTRWSISGNYILVIYDEDEDVVIVKRFLVSEDAISISATLGHPKDVSKYYTHQSLDIQLNSKDYNIVDPLTELKVDVLQNDRWSDAILDVSPKYLMGDDITFDEFDPFLFEGYNEFRNADFRTLKSTNIDIHSIDVRRTGVYIELESDPIRKNSNYFLWTDIGGNFLILNLDNSDDIYSNEYCYVKFSLKSYAQMPGYKVYVIGGFSEWQLYDENELQYDPTEESYTGTIFLKQGVYDYYYALVDSKGNINYSDLEGSFYQTENDYTVLVYQRKFGSTYDRLIGGE